MQIGKCKQPHSGFELGLPSPLPIMMTVVLQIVWYNFIAYQPL